MRRTSLAVVLVAVLVAAPAAVAAEPWEWTASHVTLATGENVAAGSEAAAMDGAGNLTAVWVDGAAHVRAATTGPGGAAPNPAVSLGTITAGRPAVAATGNGTAVAAWVDGRDVMSATLRAGTWSAAAPARSVAAPSTLNAVAVGADDAGDVLLAWEETGHNVPGPGTHETISAAFGSAAAGVVDDTDASPDIAAVVDGSGRGTVGWTAGDSVLVSSATAASASWPAATQLDRVQNDAFSDLSLAETSSGTLAAAWTDSGQARAKAGNAAATNLGAIDATAGPTIATDDAGNATVAWPQGGAIVARTLVPGATNHTVFSSATQGAIAERGKNPPAIVADPGGGVVAAFATVPPDRTAPTISVTAPANGGVYAQGSALRADYTCADTGGSGIASCAGTLADGAVVPTGAPGAQTFVVKAQDNAGNTATATVHYTIVVPAPPPPTRHSTGPIGALLARTPSGGVPDAPASEPTISQDARIDRYVAYVSAATNIVPGSGSYKNVFLVKRAQPWGTNGTPWNIGATVLASRGLGGQPANGDSFDPSLDGADIFKSKCLAFGSAASNLVSGDTNNQADAFLMKLPSGKLKRYPGKGGAVTAVAVDGKCTKLAFVSGGTLYVKTLAGGKVKRASARGGVTSPDLSADGKSISFARNGTVYGGRIGHARKVGKGSDPSGDGFGRYVAFVSGGSIVQATIGHRGTAIATGAFPSMTSGGHFVFFAQGGDVRLNVKKKAVAGCPAGDAGQLAGSPHGNYVAYTCSNGNLYLGYVGAQ